MNWNFGNIDFSTYPFYNEQPLGLSYSAQQSIIRLWAPTAQRVLLRLYKQGSGDSHFSLIEAERKEAVWEARIDGDCHGIYYTVQCLIEDKWMDEVPDPYAYAVGVNGKRAMICDLHRTHPDGWENDRNILPEHYTDMVLYELHVRDFSIDDHSGMQHKGKYLAFTEAGSRSPEGVKTGPDHLSELGITHVHLLPVFDFFTVDEEHPEKKQYNWGYDPLNYNAPEGSYATDAHNGATRINELKQLIKALHDKGIGVIMDVVYNHTGLINHSCFNQTVPGYYYRQRPNGTFSDASGCGNEIASERAMVRKYLIDSIVFWASEYHIDGFRFDLMGIFDIDTMNAIRKALDQIDQRIVMYGEGWTAASSPMDEKRRAVKSNSSKLKRIALFNDDFRDAIKGHWAQPNSLGFVSGQTLNEESLKYGIVAATGHPQINYAYVASIKWAWSMSPQSCVNYVSCHDNYTLYDKLKLSHPEAKLNELSRMVCLAGAILLTSQGIPFLHAGVEMLRTKKGNGNSYKAGDEINLIDWSRKAMFSYVFDYFKKLIAIRKKHPAFRLPDTASIQKHLRFSDHYLPGVVAYTLGEHANNDSWKQIQLIFNNNSTPIVFPVEAREWTEIASGLAIDEQGLKVHRSHSIFVPPLSMMLLVSKD
ncbi:type I pullulanase [Roseimarinus sediminis]|uniref:type I pullulanase n=1 Tax=Roseimarinus sediminis TaxID=1610899 RepID=UPI003D19B540